MEAIKLPHVPARFDDRAMADHDRLLGVAGTRLSFAYETANAIAGVAQILRANAIAKDSDEDGLTDYQAGRCYLR